MSTNVVNNVPYMRTSREFPEELKELTLQIDKAYIDTANAVNNRTISLFPTTKPAITGEAWFLTGNQKQQGLRQVFLFTTVSTSIAHGIPFFDPARIVRGFGNYVDGTNPNSYGLIYGTTVAIAGQISFYVTNTSIVFVTGAGAPAVSSGKVIIEWVSNP